MQKMEFNIQLFGGRGSTSGSEKQTGRYKLQQVLYNINANDNTRVVIKNSDGEVLFNPKITQINSALYTKDLREPAKNVYYRQSENTIYINQAKKRRK